MIQTYQNLQTHIHSPPLLQKTISEKPNKYQADKQRTNLKLHHQIIKPEIKKLQQSHKIINLDSKINKEKILNFLFPNLKHLRK